MIIAKDLLNQRLYQREFLNLDQYPILIKVEDV